MGLVIAQKLRELATVLTEALETEHFVLRYVLRNPRRGKGHASQGVASLDLVHAYAAALEEAYRVLRTEAWLRDAPLTGPEGRTEVFIGDVQEPFVTVWRGQYPVLVLSAGYAEPALVSERERIRAEAAHEVMHLFNFQQRPMMAIRGDWQAVLESLPWQWLDEGMALCLEGIVFEGNQDRLRFARTWINQPEWPLDDKRALYQTGMFLHYLYKRFGYALVNEVWLSAARTETPWTAFDRLLRPLETTLAEAFCDYCSAAFFLRDPHSQCYEPEVEERFGERALTESFVLQPDAHERTESQLDHLACRYFRFVLTGGVRRLRVRLLTTTTPENTVLRAELAELTPAGTRADRQLLLPQSSAQSGTPSVAPVCLHTEWQGAHSQQDRQFILVVSNFGRRPQQENLQIPHDDGQTFKLEITAD